jgi:phage host-nuclease inhibitor protein Gam
VAVTPDTEPSVEEVLDRHLDELGQIVRELAKLQAQWDAEVNTVKKKYKSQVDALTARRDETRDALAEYASAHRSKLLTGRGKIVQLRSGTIRWKYTKPTLSIAEDVSEEVVVRRIRQQRGLKRFTKVGKRTLNKTALVADPEFVARIRGLRVIQREDFIIKPTKAQTEIVKQGSPLTVRGQPTEKES